MENLDKVYANKIAEEYAIKKNQMSLDLRN